MTAAPGSIVDDKYELLEKIGSGGFGTVYRARHIHLDRNIALKLLETATFKEAAVRRFEREAQILQNFRTKLIPAVYGFGQWDGRRYMALELLDGKSLASAISGDTPIELRRVIPLITDVAEALKYAHAQGVVHRDLSPSNIILVQGEAREEARVIDFGLASLTEMDLRNSQKLTDPGFALGSFFYMSPEQCLAQDVDHRADIYALGCIIYQMLTGRPPFDGDNPVLIMKQHVNDAPRALPETFPAELREILRKMLQKDPQERYEDCAQFLNDWKALSAPPVDSPGGRNLCFSAFSGAVIVIVLAAVSLWYMRPAARLSAHQYYAQGESLLTTLDASGPHSEEDDEEARSLLRTALETDKQTHELSIDERAKALFDIGITYCWNQKGAEAVPYAEQGLQVASTNHDFVVDYVNKYAYIMRHAPTPELENAVARIEQFTDKKYSSAVRGEAIFDIAELLLRERQPDAAKSTLDRLATIPGYKPDDARLKGVKASVFWTHLAHRTESGMGKKSPNP